MFSRPFEVPVSLPDAGGDHPTLWTMTSEVAYLQTDAWVCNGFFATEELANRAAELLESRAMSVTEKRVVVARVTTVTICGKKQEIE